jgi:hypothetical protein
MCLNATVQTLLLIAYTCIGYTYVCVYNSERGREDRGWERRQATADETGEHHLQCLLFRCRGVDFWFYIRWLQSQVAEKICGPDA